MYIGKYESCNEKSCHPYNCDKSVCSIHSLQVETVAEFTTDQLIHLRVVQQIALPAATILKTPVTAAD